MANPYGSYVSSPQPSYAEPAPAHLDSAAYGSGYAAGRQAVASTDWYASSVTGSLESAGYLPAPTNGTASGYGRSGDGQNASERNAVSPGLPGHFGPGQPGYPADGYGLAYPGPGYHSGQPGPAGGYGQQSHLMSPYDQRGYGAPELGYGQDGYQGYPGYGGGR